MKKEYQVALYVDDEEFAKRLDDIEEAISAIRVNVAWLGDFMKLKVAPTAEKPLPGQEEG